MTYLDGLQKLNPGLARLFARYEQEKQEREQLAAAVLANRHAIRQRDQGQRVEAMYAMAKGENRT